MGGRKILQRTQPAIESQLRGHSLRQTLDSQDRYIVFLAEGLGGVGDVEGGLPCQVVDAVESKQLSGGLAGFDYSVGHEQDAVAGVQVEADFFVGDIG